MSSLIVQRVALRWDRGSDLLWVDVGLEDGRDWSVGVPVSYVAGLVCHYLERFGAPMRPEIGDDLESVDGFGSWLKKAKKKAGKVARKATKAATRDVVRHARRTVSKVYRRAAPASVRRVVSRVSRPVQQIQRKVERKVRRLQKKVQHSAVYRLGQNPQLLASRKGRRQLAREVERYGPTALQAASTAASFVPGAGTGLAAGLGTAAALSQGRSWQEAARQGALQALPGGALTRAAVEAGIGVASGKRVDRALLAGARSAVPGGPAGQAAFETALQVARGRRPDRALKAGVARAARSMPAGPARAAAQGLMGAVQGQRLDRAMLGAATDIAKGQLAGQADRMFGAVGGRGLAALASANKVAVLTDQAQAAAQRLRAGRGDASDRALVKQAAQVARGVRQLARSSHPEARMAVASLARQPAAMRRTSRAQPVVSGPLDGLAFALNASRARRARAGWR